MEKGCLTCNKIKSSLRTKPIILSFVQKTILFVIIKLVKIYQYCISPLLGPHCRFQPTCSDYALQALTRFGLLKGLVLTTKRVCSCHPWHKGGYDPVPEFTKISN